MSLQEMISNTCAMFLAQQCDALVCWRCNRVLVCLGFIIKVTTELYHQSNHRADVQSPPVVELVRSAASLKAEGVCKCIKARPAVSTTCSSLSQHPCYIKKTLSIAQPRPAQPTQHGPA